MRRFLLVLIFASTPLAASHILQVTAGTMQVIADNVNPSWSLDVSGHGFALVASGLWMAPGVNSECATGCEAGETTHLDIYGHMYSSDVQLTVNGTTYGTGALGPVNVAADPVSAGTSSHVPFSIHNWQFSVYDSLSDVTPQPELQDVLLRGGGTAAVEWVGWTQAGMDRFSYIGATYTFTSSGSQSGGDVQNAAGVPEPGTFEMVACAASLIALIRFVLVRIAGIRHPA